MGKCICSVCGTDKKLGRCEHINGRSYAGKTAFSVLSDAKDAYEFSFVAVPAQREAGVTKAFKNDIEFTAEETDMQEIIKSLDCGKEVVLSKSQAKSLADYAFSLSEDAQLGREYKKNLANEVVSLCSVAMPEMDLNIFQGVAQVMTTKELLSFKKAFSKSRGGDDVSPQLAKKSANKKINNNQFKI